VLLITIVVASACAALVAAYATLLPWVGIPVPCAALFAVLLASSFSGIAGLASAALCGAALLRIIGDPIQVVEIMLVCSIAIQVLSVTVVRRDIDPRDILGFLTGGVLGLPIGVGLLLHLGTFGLKGVIGGLPVAYASYALFQRPRTIALGGSLADIAVGFLSGVTGGLAALPGGAMAIWCGLKGWDKRRQRGAYHPFILIMQVIALLLIQFMRAPDAQGYAPDLTPLLFVPAALLGIWLSPKIVRATSDRIFVRAVNLLLLASGIALLA
jgi:uncharacterized membrane protein YfcA